MTYRRNGSPNQLVDVTPVREHIEWLYTRGVPNDRTLSIAVGWRLSPDTIRRIRTGRCKYVTRATAGRLLALDQTAINEANRRGCPDDAVDATVARANLRRLLARDGITQSWLARQLGVNRSLIGRCLAEAHPGIRRRHADAIAQLTQAVIRGQISPDTEDSSHEQPRPRSAAHPDERELVGADL